MKKSLTFAIAIITFFAVNTVSAKNLIANVTKTAIESSVKHTDYQWVHTTSENKKVTVRLVIYADAKIPNKMITSIEDEQMCSDPIVTTVTIGKDCYNPNLKKTADGLVFNFEDQYEKNVPIALAYAQK